MAGESMNMKGIVSAVHPVLKENRLKVIAEVKTDQGDLCEAYMPEREVAALLPRSILLGESTKAHTAILGTIKPILARMTEGRSVRLWKYEGRYFFSFLPWKSVRFSADP
jgi:hypothetical protein